MFEARTTRGIRLTYLLYGGKMADEAKTNNWTLKDGLVVVPFLASGLAMTWEVGFFLRIKGGAFGLFSVAEHVTFALQALPVALALTSLIIVGSSYNNILNVYGAFTGLSVRYPVAYERLRRYLWLLMLLMFTGRDGRLFSCPQEFIQWAISSETIAAQPTSATRSATILRFCVVALIPRPS
jgi:hypothetical protein